MGDIKIDLNQAFTRLMKELQEVVMRDSVLSHEEQYLLDMIKEELDVFTAQLEIIEGVTEENLADMVETKIREIVSKAIEISKLNNVINDDEIQILKTLMDFNFFDS